MIKRRTRFHVVSATAAWLVAANIWTANAEDAYCPELPPSNATVEILAQSWTFQAGPRTVKVYLYYPAGKLAEVNEKTGLMLSLHNWGGTGSAGGNVTLMANKLAPRTFACVVDLSGMPKLTDDVAFHLPGGSDLNAGYVRDPKHPRYLSKDAQALRFTDKPEHLATMKALASRAKIIAVHGSGDTTGPFADAREMVENMIAAGLDVDHYFITKADLDGRTFTNIGHGVEDRTRMVLHVADKYLLPQSAAQRVRPGPSDFDLRGEQVRYATDNGAYVISYQAGYPVGRFETTSN